MCFVLYVRYVPLEWKCGVAVELTYTSVYMCPQPRHLFNRMAACKYVIFMMCYGLYVVCGCNNIDVVHTVPLRTPLWFSVDARCNITLNICRLYAAIMGSEAIFPHPFLFRHSHAKIVEANIMRNDDGPIICVRVGIYYIYRRWIVRWNAEIMGCGARELWPER